MLRDTKAVTLWYVLVSYLLTVTVSGNISELWCPTPDPCHCISNQVVYCSYARLTAMPYFMRFDRTYWELDLTQNFLTELPEAGLSGIHVNKLSLGWNAIKSIHPQAFVGVQFVSEIDLCHNRLKHIPAGVFAPLSELSTLKLCYNQLTELMYGAFRDLSHLTELDLSGNDLSVVPTEALSQVTTLHRLILRNTKLKKIDAYAFNALPLLYLDLAENGKPLELPPEAFCGLQPQMVHTEPGVIDWSGIKTLLLDHNGMSSLHPCISKIVWTLNTVDISGNPLYCDCSLLLLRELGSGAQFSGAQCAAPVDRAGTYLQHIAQDTYDCSRNRSSLSCSSVCDSEPPAGKHRDSSAAALSDGECVILAHPLLIWGFLVFCSLHSSS